MNAKQRILFVAENICLAQVVRLVTLARGLSPAHYEVHFACSEFDPLIFAGTSFTQWRLATIDGKRAMQRLARGERIYDFDTLSRYADDELELLAKVRPALVIGDFRLSLPVSARVAGVPCATLINAYWSPLAIRQRFPVPDHPIVRLVGVELAERYLPEALPKVFAHFAAPMNRLRKRHGQRELASLPEVLTDGDFTLFPDIPELCPTRPLPAHQRYLGAVQWSPELALPSGLDGPSGDWPLVYATLGSSGDLEALPAVLEAVSRLPIGVVVATAARLEPSKVPANAWVTSYVAGHAVARRAAFVISNGGSSTGYQALAEGVPVLGLPFNLDQYLAMTAVVEAGCGVLVRSGGVKPQQIVDAAQQLLREVTFKQRAESMAREFARRDCHVSFGAFLKDVLGSPLAQSSREVATLGQQ